MSTNDLAIIVELTYNPEPNAPYRWRARSPEFVGSTYGETAGTAVDELIKAMQEYHDAVARESRAAVTAHQGRHRDGGRVMDDFIARWWYGRRLQRAELLLAQLVYDMREWGSWEDGIPGEHLGHWDAALAHVERWHPREPKQEGE